MTQLAKLDYVLVAHAYETLFKVDTIPDTDVIKSWLNRDSSVQGKLNKEILLYNADKLIMADKEELMGLIGAAPETIEELYVYAAEEAQSQLSK